MLNAARLVLRRGGHLDVLKWLRDQDPPCPWDWETCAWAAEGGHLDVLKWARSQDPPCPQDLPCPWNEVLKWLRSQDLQKLVLGRRREGTWKF